MFHYGQNAFAWEELQGKIVETVEFVVEWRETLEKHVGETWKVFRSMYFNECSYGQFMLTRINKMQCENVDETNAMWKYGCNKMQYENTDETKCNMKTQMNQYAIWKRGWNKIYEKHTLYYNYLHCIKATKQSRGKFIKRYAMKCSSSFIMNEPRR